MDVSADGGRTWRVLAALVTGRSHTHTGIPEPGSARRYRVRAIGTGGVEWPPSQPVDATTGPGIVRIEVVSRPAEGDTYRVGEEIAFRMHLAGGWTFHDPHLPLLIGDRTRDAGCRVNFPTQGTAHRCPDNRELAVDFSYVVQAGDLDQDGIAIAADSFWGNSEEADGGLYDNQADPMPHAAVGPLAGHKVDGRPLFVSISEPQELREGETATLAVELSRPAAAAVTVTWSTAEDSSAHAGDSTAPATEPRRALQDDYEAVVAGTLTFKAGETQKSLTVTSRPDNLDEYDETFLVRLDTVQGGSAEIAASSMVTTLKILDATPAPALEAAAEEAVEGAGLAFHVTLAGSDRGAGPDAELVHRGRDRVGGRGLHGGRGGGADHPSRPKRRVGDGVHDRRRGTGGRGVVRRPVRLPAGRDGCRGPSGGRSGRATSRQRHGGGAGSAEEPEGGGADGRQRQRIFQKPESVADQSVVGRPIGVER